MKIEDLRFKIQGLESGIKKPEMIRRVYPHAKPYTRWWWFSGRIKEEDIRHQLDWLKENGFGGAEIAWVYPLRDSDTGPRWLSEEWSQAVAYCKKYAQSIGLGCDFTFGTKWPFGGTLVEERDASRTFGGLSPQRLEHSWEVTHSPPGHILNHLDRNALGRYAERTGAGLGEALKGTPSALFCDSWEVDTEKLWTDGFGEAFFQRFGYDLRPYMASLDDHPDVRYDYRVLLGDYVLNEFYIPFTEHCHRLGALSRVQCHGAPTDLLAAYAEADVPESEAILFDPHFAQFAASAAALKRNSIVSAEAFTCLYGWKPRPGPGPHQGEENVADMKLLADGLFANGVNFILWHGMPFNPDGGQNRFYASVHVGPDSGFVGEIPGFNTYLEQVSGIMRRGETYSDVAVYLPLEDNRMKGELPQEFKRPSARYFWELQHQRFPEEAASYRPLWVSAHFLRQTGYSGGKLRCGEAEFSSLYVDAEWLDREALKDILRLAGKGFPVCMKQKPAQPGLVKDVAYPETLERLFSLPNVHTDFGKTAIHPPLLEGKDLLESWCRVDGEEAYLFLAHPLSKTLSYPMRYGQSYCREALETAVVLNWRGLIRKEIKLRFDPYQSLLLRIESKGGVAFEGIRFEPREPAREVAF